MCTVQVCGYLLRREWDLKAISIHCRETVCFHSASPASILLHGSVTHPNSPGTRVWQTNTRRDSNTSVSTRAKRGDARSSSPISTRAGGFQLPRNWPHTHTTISRRTVSQHRLLSSRCNNVILTPSVNLPCWWRVTAFRCICYLHLQIVREQLTLNIHLGRHVSVGLFLIRARCNTMSWLSVTIITSNGEIVFVFLSVFFYFVDC